MTTNDASETPGPSTRWIRRHGALWVALALALVFCLPSLHLGFGWDDYEMLNVLEGTAPSWYPGTPLGLARHATGAPDELAAIEDDIYHGQAPWACVPTSGKLMAYRPLGSLSLTIDHALFGLAPMGYHAHAVLLFLVVLSCVYALYRRVLPGAPLPGPGALSLSGLALLFFAADPIHLEVIQRVSARMYYHATIFGILGLLAHLRWRREGWRAGGVVSALCFLLALLAGEMALQMLGYVIAYELLAATDAWQRRLRALAPSLLIAAGFIVHFRLAGYGVDAYGYINPLDDLPAWLAVAPGVLADFALELILSPASILVWLGWHGNGLELAIRAWPAGVAVRLVAAAALVALVARLLRAATTALPDPRVKGAAWLALGALLALVPVVRGEGQASPRSLFIPSVGASAALAVALCPLLASRAAPARRLLRQAAVLAALFAAVRVIAGTASGLEQMLQYRADQGSLYDFLFYRQGTRIAEHPEPDAAPPDTTAPPAPEETIVLAVPYVSTYWPLYREFTAVVDDGRRVPVERVSFLSTARSHHELIRTGERTFRLRLREAGSFPWSTAGEFPWIDSLQVCSLPVGDLRPPGSAVVTRAAIIHIREVERGDRYRSIDVTLRAPLEATWFAVWRDGALRRVRLPLPGQRMMIPLDIAPLDPDRP